MRWGMIGALTIAVLHWGVGVGFLTAFLIGNGIGIAGEAIRRAKDEPD